MRGLRLHACACGLSGPFEPFTCLGLFCCSFCCKGRVLRSVVIVYWAAIRWSSRAAAVSVLGCELRVSSRLSSVYFHIYSMEASLVVTFCPCRA